MRTLVSGLIGLLPLVVATEILGTWLPFFGAADPAAVAAELLAFSQFSNSGKHAHSRFLATSMNFLLKRP